MMIRMPGCKFASLAAGGDGLTGFVVVELDVRDDEECGIWVTIDGKLDFVRCEQDCVTAAGGAFYFDEESISGSVVTDEITGLVGRDVNNVIPLRAVIGVGELHGV
jgi:hypothetical protein